jgi:hypothetical protein
MITLGIILGIRIDLVTNKIERQNQGSQQPTCPSGTFIEVAKYKPISRQQIEAP